ncbi:MAG TPA: PLP-dependent aminotransferase family protein [Acidimicrobiales bacterium]
MTIDDLLAPAARRARVPVNEPPAAAITVNFDQGLPDPTLFPIEPLARCLTDTLAEDADDVLRYYGAGGPAEMQYGHLGLRERLAAWIARRDGRPRHADDVLLVNGSTDGLALAVNTFVGPGDGALVEAATYPHTRRFMMGTGATVRTVPMDDDGMVVDELDDRLAALRDEGLRPKLIYTIPTFHAPTGTVLPLERRLRLLDIARRWNVIVLEDNCYYEFSYDSAPPPTLLALDDTGLVVQSDSFSKYVAPGLRMAWLASAHETIAALAGSRQDFAVSRVIARALDRYMARGELERHLDVLRARYRTKRDLAVAALREHCQPWVSFREPAGGFYLWLEIAPTVDWSWVRAELAQRGIAVRPGDGMVAEDDPRRFVRLSCIQVPDDDIAPGIAQIGEVLAASARTSR